MRMEEATAMSSERGDSLLPGPYLIRARPRTSKVLGLADSPSVPSTPPFRSHVTVPFLWEEAPGKPKLRETAASARLPPPAATATRFLADGGVNVTPTSGSEHEDGARACPVTGPVPLKLPPRLQASAPAEHLLSPKTVLQGPYFGGGGGGSKKPPMPLRKSGSTATCRMKLRDGGGLFSWRKTTAAAGSKKDGHDLDASCCSPAASSASSSSSSSSMSHFFFDDHSRPAQCQWPQADGHEDAEDGEAGEDGAKGTVRIRRFRRNRSLPSLTRSHMWASIRKSVKQISPWS